MSLKDRITDCEKVIKGIPKFTFTAQKGTELELLLAGVNKMYETLEIITLQQEIIAAQQKDLESARENFKKICNEDDLGLVSRYSLAAMREIDKSLEKTKEKIG